MQHRCLVCKYLDKNISGGLSASGFFKGGDQCITIYLCYLHSIEYFKVGQRRFFSQHSKFFREFTLPEDGWVVEYLNDRAIDAQF